jgi:adenosylcobinamide-GDP ribazoletransferase
MLILVLLAKYAALTSINPARLDAALITAQTLGRWAFLPMGYFNRSASEGLASKFMKGLGIKAVVAGTVMSAAGVLLLCRIHGLLAFGVAVAVILFASLYFRNRLGGLTGDCFGATFQIVEIATYAAFLT